MPSQIGYHTTIHLEHWRVVASAPGRIELQRNWARLLIRTWPRVRALYRPSPELEWRSGDEVAKPIIDEQLIGGNPGFTLINGKIHHIDRDHQICFPFFDVWENPDETTQTQIALWEAIDAIPVKIYTRIRALGDHLWEAVVMASHLPSAVDLLYNNAALYWLQVRHSATLAENSQQDVAPSPRAAIRAFAQRIAHPQRRQLASFGFPEAQRWVKISKKIPMVHVMHIHWADLAQFASQPDDACTLKTLHHLPILRSQVVNSLLDPDVRPLIRPKLFKQLNDPSSLYAYEEMKLMATVGKHVPNLQRLWRKTMDIDKLSAIRFDLERIQDYLKNPSKHRISPPFKAPTGWELLDNYLAIIEEGVLQRHCLHSLDPEKMDATRLIYRITSPMRLTLELCKVGRCWNISQMAAHSNGPVPDDVRCHIYRILIKKVPVDIQKS